MQKKRRQVEVFIKLINNYKNLFYNKNKRDSKMKIGDIRMKIGDKLYRYYNYRSWESTEFERGHPVATVNIRCSCYLVEKVTRCGCWISEPKLWDASNKVVLNNPKRHFILDNSRKKFAYKTKALAMESFITRKQKQIGLLIDNLEFAKKSLSLAIDMKKKKLWKK